MDHPKPEFFGPDKRKMVTVPAETLDEILSRLTRHSLEGFVAHGPALLAARFLELEAEVKRLQLICECDQCKICSYHDGAMSKP